MEPEIIREGKIVDIPCVGIYEPKKREFFTLDHYPFKLILISGIFLFILKFFFSKNYLAIITNSVVDFLIFFVLYALLFLGYKTLGKKGKAMNIGVYSVFYIVLLSNFFIFLINSVLLDDAILMKYSLINADFGAFFFLLIDIVPKTYLLLLPVIIFGLCYLSKFNLGKLKIGKSYLKIIVSLMIIFSLMMFMFNFGSFSNIYANTIYEGVIADYQEEIKLDKMDILATNYSSELFDKQIIDYSSYSLPKNKKIMLFIMEQTSYQTFLKDIKQVPPEENFFEKVRNNTHIFTNYYTNNQDSRTTVWTILNSQLIPFESYITDWNKYYGFVLGTNDLISFFNNQSYKTQVVAAINKPGLLLSAHDWAGSTFISNFEEAKQEYLCLHSFEYQEGCEDLSILEDVKDFLLENKNNNFFMMQEFIYGHGTAYENILHKTRTEYYNDYLWELYSFMEKEGLLEDTLIMIVADHGEKGYFSKELWNYQVPLLIIQPGQEYREIKDIYSPLDFKDILLSYVFEEDLKRSNEFIFFTGQTQSSEIGYVDNIGRHFLGRFYTDNYLKIRDINGLNKTEIEDLLNIFMKSRLDSIEKSNEQEFWCINCEKNIAKAGFK